MPIRFANDRELPAACSRSPCRGFCERADEAGVEAEREVEAELDDDDRDCLDEFEAGITGRGLGCVDEGPGRLGLGLGLGLLESCLLTRATGATWRGGALGMELGPPF